MDYNIDLWFLTITKGVFGATIYTLLSYFVAKCIKVQTRDVMLFFVLWFLVDITWKLSGK